MKLKKNCGVSSSEFWYDLVDGYLNLDDMIEDELNIKKIRDAIRVLKDFEDSCNDQIEGFLQ